MRRPVVTSGALPTELWDALSELCLQCRSKGVNVVVLELELQCDERSRRQLVHTDNHADSPLAAPPDWCALADCCWRGVCPRARNIPAAAMPIGARAQSEEAARISRRSRLALEQAQRERHDEERRDQADAEHVSLLPRAT
eukprot:6852706-Prymnesium_polylepis.1